MADSADKPAQKSPLRRFAALAVILVGLAFAYAMGWQRYLSLGFLAESRESLQAYVDANFALSILGFAAIYTLAVSFSIPAAAGLTIFGGFLFGWLVGGAVVAVAATLGATIVFLAARSAFGDVLRNRVSGRVLRLAEGFEKDALSYLLALRLAPIFPFFVMNIAPALFHVPLRTYVTATFIGILPATFAYAYFGQGIDSVLEAAHDAGTEVTASDLVTPEITLAFLALGIVAAIPPFVKRFRARR